MKGMAVRLVRFTLVLTACLVATPLTASEEAPTIEISHDQVSPAEVSIQKGETVTFVNRVEMPGGHSVVADDSSFASPPLGKGQTWVHTFEEAGTFAYHVKEHPGTKGVINVK